MKLILNVAGMNCGHCEKRIENALKNIGVKAKASAKSGAVHLQCGKEKLEEVKAVIENLGYKVNG